MHLLIDLSIFRKNRDFRFLFLGQFVSFIGSMITYVALPYQVYHLTHKIAYVGLLSFLILIPLLFTALLGGALADQYSRKKILISCEIILALLKLCLALNALSPHPSLITVFILGPVANAVAGLHRPAFDGIIQQIVDKKDYPSLASAHTIVYSTGLIIGPMVGGLLIAHGGLSNAFFADMSTYVMSLTCVLCMSHIPMPKNIKKEHPFKSIMSGIKYALSKQVLIGSYLTDIVAMVFGMPYALFPAMAHHFHDPKILGYYYTAPAIGALIMSLFSGVVKHMKRYGAGIAISAALWGVSIIGLGFTWKNLWVGLGFLAFAGAFDCLSGLFRSTLWNETIPENYRGRLAGIEMVSYMSGPRLGDAEAALVASFFGLSVSIVSGGILCVGSVCLCAALLPKFWRFRSTSKALSS